ncbi:MAG TPA: hypothetical protein VFC79_09800 [Tissierellaceae bacterium]|nr:hypothetical protein [Tissierellaceae bacterium]
MFKTEIQGKLVYGDRAEYLIHMNDNTVFNLSLLLDQIYYAPKTYHLHIRIMDGCKTLYNEDGGLYLAPITRGFYSYHICANDLESCLFENTDKVLTIFIESTTLNEADYGQFVKTKLLS